MKTEILPLNLLRFLAALAVVCVHKLTPLVNLHYLPSFFGFFSSFADYGYLGVNLFFLISGFVITLSSSGRTFGEFVSARFIRLYPVFWVSVSVTSLFVLFWSHHEISWQQYFANLTMMPQLYGGYEYIDGSYWTLFVELKFYAFIACVLLLQPFIKISLQTIASILTIPLVYLTFFYNPYSISTLDSIFLTLFNFFGSEYTQYFLAGILFFGLYHNYRRYYYVPLFICYIVAVLRALDAAYTNNDPVVIVLHITFFFGMLLTISTRIITNDSLRFFGKHSRKIVLTLGALTYPTYLLHSMIITVSIQLFTKLHIAPYLASIILLSLVTGVILLVNTIDVEITQFWKKSTVIKNILSKQQILWIKKFL